MFFHADDSTPKLRLHPTIWMLSLIIWDVSYVEKIVVVCGGSTYLQKIDFFCVFPSEILLKPYWDFSEKFLKFLIFKVCYADVSTTKLRLHPTICMLSLIIWDVCYVKKIVVVCGGSTYLQKIYFFCVFLTKIILKPYWDFFHVKLKNSTFSPNTSSKVLRGFL